jgi:hypothetical protein
MKSLVTRTNGAMSAPEPIVPEMLEHAIVAYLRPDSGMFQAQLKLLPKGHLIVPRIAALIHAFDAHLRVPLNREALEEWLLPLRDAVTFRPDEAEFDGRIESVLKRDPDLPPLPLACLNARSYAAAVRTFRKWPSGAELIELLEAQTRVLVLRRTALQAICDGIPRLEEPPQKPREPPTDEERAAVSGKVSALVQDLRGRSERAAPPGAFTAEVRPKSGALPPHVLAATLRQQIAKGPPDEVEGLKRRLDLLERSMPKAAE